ncbi:MAG: hypothetical protein GTO40_11455, partial [Deltaproteobacteria bacterium]|nr:hypothetical protein [Deltaproteobacteria bacterium]
MRTIDPRGLRKTMTSKGKTGILWLMMLTALGLLGFGVSMAYSLYKDLESTVREAQDA